MKRIEGILKTHANKHGQDKTTANATQIVNTEYNNYVELCEFCGEQPKGFDEWIMETITPNKEIKQS